MIPENLNPYHEASFSKGGVEVDFIKQVGIPYSTKNPTDIAFTSDGGYYIAMGYSNRILKFAANGSLLFRIDGKYGDINPLTIWAAQGIATNSSDYLFVADSGNNRVLVFDPTGKYHATIEGFAYPWDIAINATDYLYVSDSANHTVQIFDPQNHFIGKFGQNGAGNGDLNYPRGIAINGTGYVYVAEQGNHRVTIFTQTGEYVNDFGSSGTGNGQFQTIYGVSINDTGQVFVSDFDSFSSFARVQSFNQLGEFEKNIGSYGSGEEDFGQPNGMSFNQTGELFVADFYRNRIKVFTGNGEFIRQFGRDSLSGSNPAEFWTPGDVAVNSTGYVFIADRDNNRIQILSPDGDFFGSFGEYGSEPGKFDGPSGIAINGSDYLYITDIYNTRVQIFSPTNQFVAEFGEYGADNGQFDTPVKIAVNSTGFVYVSDSNLNRIQIFTPTGQFVGKFGDSGINDGQFDGPVGIAFNSTGHVFVADSYNSRIQIFTSTGEFVNKFGEDGVEPGNFSKPYDIFIDGLDYIYVLDTGSDTHLIQIFRPDYSVLSFYGTYLPEHEGFFDSPTGLFVTKNGRMYIVDADNSWLQIFEVGMQMPAPVLNEIVPSPSSTGNIELSWNAVWYGQNYKIYRSTSPISEVPESDPIATTQLTTYTDFGLGNGTYYYLIVAEKMDYQSGASNVQSVEVGIPPETSTTTGSTTSSSTTSSSTTTSSSATSTASSTSSTTTTSSEVPPPSNNSLTYVLIFGGVGIGIVIVVIVVKRAKK
jgi:hypothetical protein